MKESLLNRDHYSTLTESVYLNQASLGLVGTPAVEAMRTFMEHVARHGNLRMSDEDEVAFFANLRGRASELLGCASERVAIVSGASELLGQLPLLLRPASDSNVVLIGSDFPAITRPWLGYAEQTGCALKFVADDPTQTLTASVLAAVDSETAVIAISHTQFATGSMVDIPKLRQAATAVGAKLVVDITQAAGAIPLNIADWQADVVISSGYKWLGGHGGVALGVFSDALLEQTPPLLGWMGAPDPFDFDAMQMPLANDARRYTKSTMSYMSLAGLTVAIEQLLALDSDALITHAQQLAEQLIASVAPSGWRPFRHLTDPSAAPHIITLAHPQYAADDVVAKLRSRTIVCSSRNDRIRVSLAPFNNEQDIMLLSDALAAISMDKK